MSDQIMRNEFVVVCNKKDMDALEGFFDLLRDCDGITIFKKSTSISYSTDNNDISKDTLKQFKTAS